MAPKRIKILDEFLNGTWLNHNQLFGLATNLIYTEDGYLSQICLKPYWKRNLKHPVFWAQHLVQLTHRCSVELLPVK